MNRFKTASSSVLTFFAFFCGYAASVMSSEPAGRLLTDFSDAKASKQWLSVNDDVMGGISKGGFRITEEKTLVFSGDLSLENRGGFASIRTRPADLKLAGYDTIAVRARGDGRTYYLNLRTASQFAATYYQAPMKTEKDAWKEFRIPVADFEYTAFGRRLAGSENLKAADVRSVGFTLADKKAGPFRLEVAWIRAEKAAASGEPDIVDTAVAAGTFKTLVAAVNAAGLVDALRGKGPLTVFAPTDEAFAALPEGTVESLLKPENRDKLVAILSYHVVSGKVLLGGRRIETLQGSSLTLEPGGKAVVNGAKVIAPDVKASNGVIHVIDRVLMPPQPKKTPRQAAQAVIDLAIKRGVPLFNAGQSSACTAVYEVAVESLLQSHGEALGASDRELLRKALRKMRSEAGSPRLQAWTLRRAMDAVYASLSKTDPA